jgi:hypothetical protein
MLRLTEPMQEAAQKLCLDLVVILIEAIRLGGPESANPSSSSFLPAKVHVDDSFPLDILCRH